MDNCCEERSSSADLVAEIGKMKSNDSTSSSVPAKNSSKTLFQSSKHYISPPIFCVEIPMRVISVAKTGKIGVCNKDGCEFITKFKQKYETLNDSEILEHTLEDSEISVGLIVAVSFKNEWYRGIVENIVGDDDNKMAEVYMMDYVSYTTVSLQDIRKVSCDDRNKPCRSFEFSLFGVTNMSDNYNEHEGFSSLKEFLLDKSFLVEFVYSKRVNKTRYEYVGFMKLLDLESKDDKCYKDVGDLILRNGWTSYKSPLAISSELTSENWTFNFPSLFEPQELALHTNVAVTIAHVKSLNEFYVRKKCDSEIFSLIQSRLARSIRQSYEGLDLWNNEEHRDTSDFIGMTFVHKKWHRVQLRRLYQDTKMAEVFLMDRGDICLQPFEYIYKVPQDVMQYPSLVFRCSLHLNLTPQGECLWKLLKKKLRRLHKKCTYGHKLTLNCFKIVRNIHSVNLDTGHSEEYGSALVKLGYATYDEDENEKLVEPESIPLVLQNSRDLLWFRANNAQIDKEELQNSKKN